MAALAAACCRHPRVCRAVHQQTVLAIAEAATPQPRRLLPLVLLTSYMTLLQAETASLREVLSDGATSLVCMLFSSLTAIPEFELSAVLRTGCALLHVMIHFLPPLLPDLVSTYAAGHEDSLKKVALLLPKHVAQTLVWARVRLQALSAALPTSPSEWMDALVYAAELISQPFVVHVLAEMSALSVGVWLDFELAHRHQHDAAAEMAAARCALVALYPLTEDPIMLMRAFFNSLAQRAAVPTGARMVAVLVSERFLCQRSCNAFEAAAQVRPHLHACCVLSFLF